MTAFYEARVREDFDLWWTNGIDLRGPVGIGVHNEARAAWLAAARHYSAEVERLRAELADRCDQVDSLQQRLDEIKVRLSSHCTDELIVDRIRALQATAGEVKRLRGERDDLQRRYDFKTKCQAQEQGELLDAANALPEGYRADAEHSLADRVKELADDLRRARAETDEIMADYQDLGARMAETPAPSPLERARGDVFGPTKAATDVLREREKQRAKWGDAHDDTHADGMIGLVGADVIDSVVSGGNADDAWGLIACHPDERERLVIGAALILAEIERRDRALSQPDEADPVGELRHALGLVEFGMESDGDRVLTRAECAVVARSIRSALAAKEPPK